MDDTLPPTPAESPRPSRRDLDSWRGDIRERPPIWKRRPRSAFVRVPRPKVVRPEEKTGWA